MTMLCSRLAEWPKRNFSDGASSTSLLSRHLHSVQVQVRALQSELAVLKDSTAFGQDRLDNLEHICNSLASSVQGLTDRLDQVAHSQAVHSAGLQAQAIAVSRLARRLASLERASF